MLPIVWPGLEFGQPVATFWALAQHVATHRNTVARSTQHVAPNQYCDMVVLACCDPVPKTRNLD